MATKTKTLYEKVSEAINKEHIPADEFAFKTSDGTYVVFFGKITGANIYEIQGELKSSIPYEDFLEYTLIDVMAEMAAATTTANVRGTYYGYVYQ